MNTDASILETIKAVPDISSPEIAHLLDIAPSNVSARLSLLYRQGNLRREKKQVEGARKPPFAYRWQQGFVPDQKPCQRHVNRAVEPSTGAATELAELRARLVELEAWQADAVDRFPELAVDKIVLEARRIVADEMRGREDKRGVEDVLKGRRDDSVLVRSVVAALERTAA